MPFTSVGSNGRNFCISGMKVMSSLHLRLHYLTPGAKDHVREEKVLRTLSLFPSMLVVFLPLRQITSSTPTTAHHFPVAHVSPSAFWHDFWEGQPHHLSLNSHCARCSVISRVASFFSGRQKSLFARHLPRGLLIGFHPCFVSSSFTRICYSCFIVQGLVAFLLFSPFVSFDFLTLLPYAAVCFSPFWTAKVGYVHGLQGYPRFLQKLLPLLLPKLFESPEDEKMSDGLPMPVPLSCSLE